MSDDDSKTLVVVSDGGSNKLFVGWTIWDEDEFKKEAEARELVHIQDARILREVTIPTPQGLSITVQVIPYGACMAGCELKILVTHYFFPNKVDAKKLEELIAACKKSELADRAHRSGLSMARDGRVGPDGRRVD